MLYFQANNQINCFSYFILLIIHLFIFNAGPMLIAVFITEMVILHKYVYLLLLLLLLLLSYLQPK